MPSITAYQIFAKTAASATNMAQPSTAHVRQVILAITANSPSTTATALHVSMEVFAQTTREI
jgi:uncharacterized protein (DUF2252 family)